jgi:transcriptional regulator with XRE-family HTH domain
MDDWDRIEAEFHADPATEAAIRRRKAGDELALALLALRSAAGISQRELALRAGMTQPEICRLETGEVQPLWDTVYRVLGALDAEVSLKVTGKNGRVLRRRLTPNTFQVTPRRRRLPAASRSAASA